MATDQVNIGTRSFYLDSNFFYNTIIIMCFVFTARLYFQPFAIWETLILSLKFRQWVGQSGHPPIVYSSNWSWNFFSAKIYTLVCLLNKPVLLSEQVLNSNVLPALFSIYCYEVPNKSSKLDGKWANFFWAIMLA